MLPQPFNLGLDRRTPIEQIIELLGSLYTQLGGGGISTPATEQTLSLALAQLQAIAKLTDIQPTQLYILKDGVKTAVSLDDIAPYTCVPIPVALTDINGSTVVNVTASGLNVKIVHNGTDPSSIRLGDGTTIVGVTLSNELKVKEATLGNLTDARSTATDTTSVSIMQVLKEISYMAQNPVSPTLSGTVTAQIEATNGDTLTATSSALDINIKSGSIANTSFDATQSTASNLKAEAHLYDSSTNGISSTSNALDVNVKSGCIPSALDKYKIQDQDTTGTTLYYGFAFTTGQYYIMAQNTAATYPTFRYANVSNNVSITTYAAAWAGRAGLTYDYLFNLTSL